MVENNSTLCKQDRLGKTLYLQLLLLQAAAAAVGSVEDDDVDIESEVGRATAENGNVGQITDSVWDDES